MDYLDQLKKSCKAPDDEPKKTKELPKPNCLVFLGSSSGVFEKIQALDDSHDRILFYVYGIMIEKKGSREGVVI